MPIENPFSQGKKKPVKADDEGDFAILPDTFKGGNFCPFLTAAVTDFVPLPPQIVAQTGQDGAIPMQMRNLMKCIGERCAFWHKGREDCLLKLQARAMVDLAERAPAVPS